MKTIVKWFISDKKLAKWSADGIQKAINDCNYSDQIAKYGDMADKFTEVLKWMTEILKDGKVDDLEKADIEAKLLPLYTKLMELI